MSAPGLLGPIMDFARSKSAIRTTAAASRARRASCHLIIVATAHAMTEARDDCLRVADGDCLAKPIVDRPAFHWFDRAVAAHLEKMRKQAMRSPCTKDRSPAYVLLEGDPSETGRPYWARIRRSRSTPHSSGGQSGRRSSPLPRPSSASACFTAIGLVATASRARHRGNSCACRRRASNSSPRRKASTRAITSRGTKVGDDRDGYLRGADGQHRQRQTVITREDRQMGPSQDLADLVHRSACLFDPDHAGALGQTFDRPGLEVAAGSRWDVVEEERQADGLGDA